MTGSPTLGNPGSDEISGRLELAIPTDGISVSTGHLAFITYYTSHTFLLRPCIFLGCIAPAKDEACATLRREQDLHPLDDGLEGFKSPGRILRKRDINKLFNPTAASLAAPATSLFPFAP
jgi:hypothetical protein